MASLQEFERLLRTHVGPIAREAALEWNESGLQEDVWGQQAMLVTPEGASAIHDPDEPVMSALFEADVHEFNRACPGLAVDEDMDCVDLWIKYFPRPGEIDADLEGSNVEQWLRDQGYDSLADAMDSASDLPSAIEAVARGLEVMLAEGRASERRPPN